MRHGVSVSGDSNPPIRGTLGRNEGPPCVNLCARARFWGAELSLASEVPDEPRKKPPRSA